MVSSELLKEFKFDEEEMELALSKDTWTVGKTGFPKSAKYWRIVLEAFNQSIEETYFWMLNHLTQTIGYAEIVKISDVFSASEQSSFFGAAQQRLGIQQDKVSQFLATTGKMVRELFQLVREVRIIDERLSYYRDSMSNSRSSESAEITLKGIWIDMVEQGAKNPASVYGMSRELQFITLPDLFFSTHPQNAKDVDEVVDSKIDFNRKVREVLKRKLRAFLEWKAHTYTELQTRRKFTLKYLRQHYDIIHMYMSWVRPYLKNIKRLMMADRAGSPDLINAFEGSVVEVELLAKKKAMKLDYDKAPKTNKLVNSVILLHFMYRTRPQMSFQQEGYQKGPLHVGRSAITIRAYGWTDNEIKKYIEMKKKEEFELLSSVDGSVKAAMEALGDELEKYLEEAGEDFQYKIKEKKKKEEKKSIVPDAVDPFISIFRGFYELFGSFLPNIELKKKKEEQDPRAIEKERKGAAGTASSESYTLYNLFKKDHGMVDWG
ncbi:hypothetical protein JXA85_05140 [Candidatus Woesearchaeota archaeon]|nr:hypothetical protein [Candidatus Woesearchaeota archaeon]